MLIFSFHFFRSNKRSSPSRESPSSSDPTKPPSNPPDRALLADDDDEQRRDIRRVHGGRGEEVRRTYAVYRLTVWLQYHHNSFVRWQRLSVLHVPPQRRRAVLSPFQPRLPLDSPPHLLLQVHAGARVQGQVSLVLASLVFPQPSTFP